MGARYDDDLPYWVDNPDEREPEPDPYADECWRKIRAARP